MQEYRCEMEFGRDEFGQEILLKDGKFQVMMEWEKPYMEACIDALQPKGDLLEVGFGCGYSAKRIQDFHPRSHTIIEYHPVVAAKARKWAEDYPNVTIVEDTWQNALGKLGLFDEIFFDDYPLQSEKELTKLEKDQGAAASLVHAGKKRMQELEMSLPYLQEIRYQSADIDAFFSLLEKEETTRPKTFLRFFYDLEEKKNITKEQLAEILTRLKVKKYVTEVDIAQFIATREPFLSAPFEMRSSGDRLFEFLELCLKEHMREGSRFSCFLSDLTSKLEDKKFFDSIITNPFLEYREQRIPIQVPANCDYYKGDSALVIVITKIK